MSRGGIWGKVVFWLVALTAMAVFMWIVFSGQADIAGTFTDFGCPKDIAVTSECPCEGQRISSGYCCDSGPSTKPCYCENINICLDYDTNDTCIKNECGVSCDGSQGKWQSNKCS